jgi:micrococcal nuclease
LLTALTPRRRAIEWLFALLAVALPAHAASFRGTVTHVTDGDTLWVRPAGGGESVELRLLHLDAPEGCQPFGPQAKKALAQRVLHQQVFVRTRGQDDYQRSLAQVRHRGEDIGAWLVREGHAWSDGYRGAKGPYEQFEAQARRARRGLWSAPGALEPRSFRRRHGRCQ